MIELERAEVARMTSRRTHAVFMLLLATAGWGLSFPGMKALGLVQQPLVPGADSWFITGLSLVYRFAAGAVVFLVICRRTLRQITWLEIKQGCGLGLFGAGGLLFQMDGLTYTAATTSAFLTQFYCILIPLVVAVRERRWPSPLTVLCVLAVLIGVGILSQLDWRTLRPGRGEIETLAGSTIFTAQILWLQRREFAGNKVEHFTMIMFATIALVCAPVTALHARDPGDCLRAYGNAAPLLLLVGLTIFSTLIAYALMNRWQPFVTATQAGLIYCAEPIFASVYAFILPAWLSNWTGIHYLNEQVTLSLIWGGGLITLANILIHVVPQSVRSHEGPCGGRHPACQ
jgi:drug/metabolite transporter (DMT)-like permease